jgi:hypothetical protein
MLLPDNTPAPPFSAKAQVSQRPISLATAAGKLLLIFHSYQTALVAARITRSIREVDPRPDQVLVVSVADMRAVPRLLRGTAKAIVKNAYLEASRQVPAGQDPADHIIILADWTGALFKAYRVPATDRHVALALIDESKVIAGSYFGAQPEEAALSLLAKSQSSDNS